MMKMNGYSTGLQYSSLPEEYAEDINDKDQLICELGTRSTVTSFVPNNSSAVADISSSTIITNNENNMQINMDIGNEKSLLVQNSPTELIFLIQNDDIVPIPSYEVLIVDRLTNMENAINNLIGYVNSLGEDIASIDAQLKSLSKNIKTIQSYIAPNTTTNVPIVSASLQNSSSNASSSTTSAKKMFKDKNLMELKHDLTSIRSFLRKMIVAVYSRNEILADKHLNDNDDRYITITEGLKDGFGLSEAALNALYGSLRETRHQLTKDVRYMKVMKPKFTRISTDNVATEPNVQDNEKITEATATGR
ncbi:unnamed protein product [Rotaria sordida]|uniref:Uncharacterized protein n=1 Tax=Rotaria sordida TaxID=392033 RepID=A0A814BER7_9BILA|nr:unnamed protein product [Rotaria sordida]